MARERSSGFKLRTSSLFHEIVLAAVSRHEAARRFPVAVSEALAEAWEKTKAALEGRCPGVRRHWSVGEKDGACWIPDQGGGPGTRLNCGDRLALAAWENTLVTFGKFDTLFVAPVFHGYWSAAFRSRLASNRDIGEFLSIPASRVVGPDGRGAARQGGRNPRDRTLVDAAAGCEHRPIVLWSLVEVVAGGQPLLARDRRQRVSTLEKAFGSLRSLEDERVTCLETFLSYSSHFPIIVKSEVATFADAEAYLRRLRRESWVGATSTIVSIRANAVWTNRGAPVDQPPDLTGGNAIRFGILLKVRPGTSRTVKERIERELAGLAEGGKKGVKVYRRPYFWDLLVVVKTTNVARLIAYITSDLLNGGVARLGGVGETAASATAPNPIVRCSTIPYWELGKDGDGGEGDGARLQAGPGRVDARRDEQAWSDLKTQFEGLQNSGRVITETAGVVEGERSPGVVSRLLYGVKFDLEWLIDQLWQLAMAWRAERLPGDQSFLRVLNYVIDIRNRLEKVVVPLARAAARRPAGLGVPDDPCLWAEIRRFKSQLVFLKSEAYTLRAEFHARTEGLQATTNTEPHILSAERTGVTDLFQHGAAALMAAYCGRWNFSREDNEDGPRLWRGVVAATHLPGDFFVTPAFQLLQLPLEFKFDSHRRLVPLAHEAAHQVACEAMTKLGRAGAELMRIWSQVVEEAVARLRRCRGRSIGPRDNRLSEVLAARLDRVKAGLETGRDFRPQSSEVLADALFWLAAGPAGVRALFELLFDAKQAGTSVHPPVWLRALAGTEAFRRLGVDPCKDPWLAEGECSCLDDVVLAHLGEAGVPGEALRRMVFEDPGASEIGALLRWWAEGFARSQSELEERLDMSISTHGFVLGALLANRAKRLRELLTWCRTYSVSRFLFYDADDEGFFRAESVEKVNAECAKIARRLLHEDEVVLDADVRQIAAAAIHPDIPRPVHPNGRILHSLVYSVDPAEEAAAGNPA